MTSVLHLYLAAIGLLLQHVAYHGLISTLLLLLSYTEQHWSCMIVCQTIYVQDDMICYYTWQVIVVL